MRPTARTVLVASAMFGVGGTAQADDSLNDMLGPREVAVGEAMRGGATGASAIGLNPAGLGLNRELVFEGGYGYRGTDSASLINASACDSTSPMPGCFFYSYSGSNPELGDGMSGTRTSHVGGVSLSRAFTPRVLLGSTAKYFRFDSDMTGETKQSGVNWDLGLTLRVTDSINLGVTGYNLYGAESAQFPRAVGTGFHMRPTPTLSFSFDARWRLEGDAKGARYGGGAEWFLIGQGAQTGYPIRAGVLHDNSTGSTYMSAGMGLANIKYGIDIAARRQVKNGEELMIMASMRFYGPRMPAPAVE